MNNKSAEVLQGIVKSVNPLKIQIVNDEKLVIGPNITYVPRHLTDYKTTVDIVQGKGSVTGQTQADGHHTHYYKGVTDNADFSSSHSHNYDGETHWTEHSHYLDKLNIYGATMTVYNALKAGERVHVLSLNSGEWYYVLDRIDEIDIAEALKPATQNKDAGAEGTLLGRAIQASIAEGVCESCGNLAKVNKASLACLAHDKFIMPGYLPYHGNCKCKDWTKRKENENAEN